MVVVLQPVCFRLPRISCLSSRIFCYFTISEQQNASSGLLETALSRSEGRKLAGDLLTDREISRCATCSLAAGRTV